jgi:hypothetical protein
MERTSISLHFGRGEPPSEDLRDYISADDRWVLGGWVTDDPLLLVLPAWRAHIDSNAIADNFLSTLLTRANDSRSAAWRRYYGDDQQHGEDDHAPRFGLVLSTRGIKSRNSSSQRGTGVSLRIAFGADRTLGKVNKNLFISELFFSLTPIRSAERLELGHELATELDLKNYKQDFGTVDLAPTGSGLFVFGSGLFPVFKVGIRRVSFSAPPSTLAVSRLEERLHAVYGRFNERPAIRFVTHLEAPDGTYQWQVVSAGGLFEISNEIRQGMMNVNLHKSFHLLNVTFLNGETENIRLPPANAFVPYSDTHHRIYISASLSKGGNYSIVDFAGPHNSSCIMGTIFSVNIETPSFGPVDYTEVLVFRWAYLSQMFNRPRGVTCTYVNRTSMGYRVSDVTFTLDPFEFINPTTAAVVKVGVFGAAVFGNGNSKIIGNWKSPLAVVQPGERKEISLTWSFDSFFSDHTNVVEVQIFLEVWSGNLDSYVEELELKIK